MIHDHGYCIFNRLAVGIRDCNVKDLKRCIKLTDFMGDCGAASYNTLYSIVSYQLAISQKYDRRSHESPSGYGPLAHTYFHDLHRIN